MPAPNFLSLMAFASTVLAQSSTSMAAAPQTSTSSATSGSNSITSHPPASTATDLYQVVSLEYLSQGMKPDAISYVLEYQYQPTYTRTDGPGFEDKIFVEKLMFTGFPQSDWYALQTDAPHRLSEEAYLITALNSEYQSVASSFYSVYYSLEGITADSSEATRVQALATFKQAHGFSTPTSSANAGVPRAAVNYGAVGGIVFGVLGML